MKIISLFLMVSAAAATMALGADAPKKIAFARDNNTIWVANMDGSGAKKVASSGVDPYISPDGTAVAFNTEGKGTERYIAVVNLGTGRTQVFKDVPSNNAFGPIWSPDGSKLLFYIFVNNNWDIGLINADGTGYRVLKAGDGDSHSYFSACWMPDGQSIYCQDLANLYHMGLDGSIIKQWSLEKLCPGGDMDSSMRFAISADGKWMLMDVNSGEDPHRKDWDGPAPGVWIMDLRAETAKKLTPMFWWEPCWATADSYVCIGQGVKEKLPSIYLRSLDGKTHKLLVKNATDPSVSR